MMSAVLTQAYRGGHPIDEVDSQSFEANRPVLMHRAVVSASPNTTHHRSPDPRSPHRPWNADPPSDTGRPVTPSQQQSDLTPSQHQLHPAETPPRGKLRLAR